MDEHELLANRFEASRGHLRAVAYRMLGSLSEAEDAVQEAWIRLSRANSSEIENLTGWLTSVVGRVCLDMLRLRRSRREESLETHATDASVGHEDGSDPEYQAQLVDSVGVALLVVLETLEPAERLAFVLHDMFAVPFDEIAQVVDRTPAAARKLASRARRRVAGFPAPNTDVAGQRKVVDAFLSAARDGDLDALVAVLAPDVVAITDAGADRPGVLRVVRGAVSVANGARSVAPLARAGELALVDGAVGFIATHGERKYSVLGFHLSDGKIVKLKIITKLENLRQLDLAVLND